MDKTHRTVPGQCIHAWVLPLFGLALTVVGSTSVSACAIPVFRYALENWTPDPYTIVIVYDGALSQEQRSLVERLRDASVDPQRPLNARVFDADRKDLARFVEAGDTVDAGTGRWELPLPLTHHLAETLGQAPLDQPSVLLYYPDRVAPPQPIWSAALTPQTTDSLIQSQGTRELASRLVNGQSAVWVFLESGDPAKDQPAFDTLQSELARMGSEIQLPDADILMADQEYRPDTQVELRVEFSVLRIAKGDASEAPLVAALLASEPDLKDFDEPIAIPVYGRGRTCFALVGRGINPDTIEESCRFICGACSCQIKQQNPGVDLLIAMNWDDQIRGSALPERALPPLTGVGVYEVDQSKLAASSHQASDQAATLDGSTAGSSAPAAPSTDTGAARDTTTKSLASASPVLPGNGESAAGPGGNLFIPMVVAIVFLLAAATAGSVWLMTRAPR